MGDVATPRPVRARPRYDGSRAGAAGLGSLGVLTMRSTQQSHSAAKASWHGLTTCSRRQTKRCRFPSCIFPAWFERAEGSSELLASSAFAGQSHGGFGLQSTIALPNPPQLLVSTTTDETCPQPANSRIWLTSGGCAQMPPPALSRDSNTSPAKKPGSELQRPRSKPVALVATLYT